jgi:hypothetical protein
VFTKNINGKNTDKLTKEKKNSDLYEYFYKGLEVSL